MLGTNRPDLKKIIILKPKILMKFRQSLISMPSAFLKWMISKHIFHKGPIRQKVCSWEKRWTKFRNWREGHLLSTKQNLPPFIHFHGTDDRLVPYNQSLILHQKLLSKGNESTHHCKNGRHNMPQTLLLDGLFHF